MSTFGATPQGFIVKTPTDILASIQAKAQARMAASLDFSVNTLLGVFSTILAAEIGDCWAQQEANDSDFDPDNASGAGLVVLAGFTGTLPLGAIASVVTETLVGSQGTLVPSGTIISVSGRANARFLTHSDATLGALPAWTTSTNYATSSRACVGSPARAYQCTQEGISASSGAGPTGSGTGIIDGTVVWEYLGAGDGAADVSMASEELDAITAPSGTLTSISTPVVGLNSATNLLDAQVGRPVETDAELRVRREQGLRAQGNAAVAAIRAKVATVLGVQSVDVFDNPTDATDGDGVPPHAVQVVVDLNAGPPANVEDLIRAAIFASTAGGIETYGTQTGTVMDEGGVSHTISFSYLTERPAYIRLDLQVTTDFPLDGVNQVLDKLLDFEADKLAGGYDLVAMQAAAIAFEVDGVFDVTNVQVGTVSPASGTRVAATSRQIVTLDTSRITITTALVTP